jgi:hypothetical protein
MVIRFLNKELAESAKHLALPHFLWSCPLTHYWGIPQTPFSPFPLAQRKEVKETSTPIPLPPIWGS